MTDVLDQIVTDTLRREGRSDYTNFAWDKGGPTKFGITARTLGKCRGLGRDATAEEVQALEEPEARAIYREQFLSPWLWVPHEAIRLVLIDWGVTTSPLNVIRGLQRALSITGDYRGSVDGVAGTQTRAAVAQANPRTLGHELLDQREHFYEGLAFDQTVRNFMDAHKTIDLHNLRGWLNRCREFRRLI